MKRKRNEKNGPELFYLLDFDAKTMKKLSDYYLIFLKLIKTKYKLFLNFKNNLHANPFFMVYILIIIKKIKTYERERNTGGRWVMIFE